MADKFKKITYDLMEKENFEMEDYLVDKVYTSYRENRLDAYWSMDEALIDCESPIEQLFMIGWVNEINGIKNTPYIELLVEEKQFHLELENKTMRIDFYLEYHLKNFKGQSKLLKIAVEFDGHEFHKATKEQVSKDNERDRLLQKHDFNIIRFSGSDIWKNPIKCVRQLENFIWAKHYGFLKGE